VSDASALRSAFDRDARRYDRARPGYPAQVFEDLRDLAGIGPGCRVLEIGPGTGQATVPLAALGCHVIAVELGENLARVARTNLARYPDVAVVVAAFELWPLPAGPFDVVLSATAFHWLDPKVRVTRAADALRPGGALAVVETQHVAGDCDFFEVAQPCYTRWDPSSPTEIQLPTVEDVPDDTAELTASGRFGHVELRRYVRDIDYTTTSYLDLLNTYSGNLALAEPDRRNLLACLGDLIEDRYGGRITKRYLTLLKLARRIT
jgi:SAM-dependent methyltransferase